jgi:hypothetical protein
VHRVLPNRKVVMAAFDRGQVPRIACINKATVDPGVDFDRLVPVLQKFLDAHFVPVWGTPATLVRAERPLAGAWSMVLLDDADAANALGYHDLTKNGLPLAKVFVKTTLAARQKVSVTACHELAEMMVDPAINLWADGPNASLYAYEMCDAVEEDEFAIDGIAMSDFVYPAYFEGFRSPRSTKFDHLGLLARPFELRKGGYSLVRRGDKVTQIFGSPAKAKRFAREDREMHRSEYRKAALQAALRKLLARN